MAAADRIADLLLRRGDIAAQGARESGRISSGLASELGQLPARTYAQVLQEKQQAQQQRIAGQTEQMNAAKLQQTQQGQADTHALDTAFQAPDRNAILAAVPGHLREHVMGIFQKADEADARAKKAKIEASDAEDDYFGHLAAGVEPFLKLGTEQGLGAAKVALDEAKAAGHEGTDQLWQQIQQQPEMLPQIIDKLKERSKTYAGKAAPGAAGFELSPGQTRFDASGKPIASLPATPPKVTPPSVGSFEDYVTRKYGPSPTPEQITEGRKVYQQADDRPRVDVSVNGAGDKLSDEAVADTAMRYHLFGTSGIPTRLNESDKKRILNENAKINTALGQSPAVAIQKQLGLKSDAASLTRATTMADATRAAQAKAEPQADLIVQLSNKVPRTQFPILNKALLAGEKNVLGDTNTQLLYGALTEFTAEYAKIIEGSANSAQGASDSSRRAAAELVSAAMTKGTLAAQIAQMKQIMDWTIKGADATREQIAGRMTSAGTPASAPPVTPDAPSGSFKIISSRPVGSK